MQKSYGMHCSFWAIISELTWLTIIHETISASDTIIPQSRDGLIQYYESEYYNKQKTFFDINKKQNAWNFLTKK